LSPRTPASWGPVTSLIWTDRWEEPYRTARIYELLRDKGGLRPEDMLKVETDTYSYPHAFLADQLSAASKTAQPKDGRTKKLIEGLKDWNGIADADSPEVSFWKKRAAPRSPWFSNHIWVRKLGYTRGEKLRSCRNSHRAPSKVAASRIQDIRRSYLLGPGIAR